jgi:hypothetical protein
MQNLPTNPCPKNQEKSKIDKLHICGVCGKTFLSNAHSKKIQKRLLAKDTEVNQRAYALYEYLAVEHLIRYKVSYEMFVESREYATIIKFIENINPNNKDRDMDVFKWLVENRYPSNKWVKEETLTMYVKWTNGKDTIGDATAKSIKFMESYCDSVGITITQYFENTHTNTIARHIAEGNISPWFLFASTKGRNALRSFTILNLDRCKDVLVFEAWEVAIERNRELFDSLCYVLDSHGI